VRLTSNNTFIYKITLNYFLFMNNSCKPFLLKMFQIFIPFNFTNFKLLLLQMLMTLLCLEASITSCTSMIFSCILLFYFLDGLI